MMDPSWSPINSIPFKERNYSLLWGKYNTGNITWEPQILQSFWPEAKQL